jgi:hypothetical protein
LTWSRSGGNWAKITQNHLFSSNFLFKFVFFGRIGATPGRSKIGRIKPVRMAYSDCLTDQTRLHKLGLNVNLEKSAFFGTQDHEATLGRSDELGVVPGTDTKNFMRKW